MAWRCFMVRESDFVQIYLRRYSAGVYACPTTFPGSVTYHNAEVIIDPQAPAAEHELVGKSPDAEMKADPRWPKHCACGRAFHPEDYWQYNVDHLYEGSPDGKLYRLRDLPPGAIWRATWMEDIQENPYSNPAGEVYALMLPSGNEWLIYGKASNSNKKWNVEGELPGITVTPSILQEGKYHGYVKNGLVTDDCEGRKFPRYPSTA